MPPDGIETDFALLDFLIPLLFSSVVSDDDEEPEEGDMAAMETAVLPLAGPLALALFVASTMPSL